jgi:hypothetical protein
MMWLHIAVLFGDGIQGGRYAVTRFLPNQVPDNNHRYQNPDQWKSKEKVVVVVLDQFTQKKVFDDVDRIFNGNGSKPAHQANDNAEEDDKTSVAEVFMPPDQNGFNIPVK